MRNNIKSPLVRKTLLRLLFLGGMVVWPLACHPREKETTSLEGFLSSYQGRNYLNGSHFDKALQCFAHAACLFKQKRMPASYANALRNMGRTHLLSARPDSALYYYLRAQEEVADFDPILFMDISTELSIICSDAGNWMRARQQMLQYRRMSATDELPVRRSSNGLYLMKEDFIEGRKRHLSVLQSSEFKIKDYQQFASEYQELYAGWYKMNANLQVLDRNIKEKYHNEVLKNENQRIRNELLRRKVWLLSIGSGAMLLVIAGFVVFYLYRRNVRRRIGNLLVRLHENERQLDEGRIETEEERQRLLHENGVLSQQIKKLSIRQRDKDELNSYLQQMNVSYTKQLKGYQEIHSLLPVERTLALSQLCRLRCNPSRGLVKSDEEWMEIFLAIDTLYGDISVRLSSYKLSMQEQRICYLIRAGFTNSIIAIATNVTPEAIAKSKQRMKSKFSLTANDAFDDFIRKL